MKNYKIVPREEKENESYKTLLKAATDRLDEAIHRISYSNKFIDDNNFKVNELIIDKLNSIIYDLEELEDATLYKPIKVEE